MKYVCNICGRELSLSGLKNHIFRTHLKDGDIKSLKEAEEILWKYIFGFEIESIEKYYLEDFLTIGEIADKFDINPKLVQNFLLFKGIKLRTNSEAKKTKKYIEKYSTTIKERYGVDNISKSEKIKEKKQKTFMRHFGYKNNFCNSEIREKAHLNIDFEQVLKTVQENLRKKYGEHIWNVAQIPGVFDKTDWKKAKEKQIKTLKERYGEHVNNSYQIPYVKERIKRSCVSKLELSVRDVLTSLGVEFHSSKTIDRYIVDLYIPSINLIVEVYGDYWHANPEIFKAEDIIRYPGQNFIKAKDIWNKDKKRENYLRAKGYDFKIIWERDIYKSLKTKDYEMYIFS